jgi:hypothetical protein
LINVKLLDAAENSGFDVLLTGDKRMRNEQKMRGRRLAVVAMSSSFAGFLASPPKVRTGPGC